MKRMAAGMELKYKWQQKIVEKYEDTSDEDLVEALGEIAMLDFFPVNHREEWEWKFLKQKLKWRLFGNRLREKGGVNEQKNHNL